MDATRYVDHYTLLGLRRGATDAQIRRAYRRLVLRYHPDRSPNEPDAAAMFLKITEAYRTLSDEEKRKQYDTTFEAFHSAARIEKAPFRPATRPVERANAYLDFASQQNPLQDRDAILGGAGAVLVFPFFLSPGGWLAAAVGLAFALLIGLFGRTGFALKHVPEEWLEFAFLGWPDYPVWLSYAFPVLCMGLTTYLGCELATSLDFPMPSGAVTSAVGAGALAAWMAAAVGRAFTYAGDPPSFRGGALVGGALGACSAGVLALLFQALTHDSMAPDFFPLWTACAISAAFGGGAAALRGALRPLGEEP